jgi:hypothetical protein
MDSSDAVVIATACAALLIAICSWRHWWTKRLAKRLLAETSQDAAPASRRWRRLMPESRYVVEISETGVSCRNPDGSTQTVQWHDLKEVEIVTTAAGPLLPDVFWVLHGSSSDCIIPQGATGEAALMERVRALPGFRNDALTDAMRSARNKRFLCWEATQLK